MPATYLAEHYNYFRDYSPDIGRYIESDPIGLEAGPNTFSYTLNNPLTWSDSFGLDQLICYYPDGVTHVGFGNANEMSTWGFYPEKHFDPYGPGAVKSDPMEKETQCKTLPATSKQDNCMQQCQVDRRKNPGTYKGVGRSCVNYIRDCLQQCGLPSGTSGDPFPWTWYRSIPSK